MRNRKWDKRELVNAVLYFEKTGCQWRLLPHDFPPFATVWSFYRRAKQTGLWERILRDLVEKIRLQAGREVTPSYGIIDSQSVKTMSAAEERGIDGGKKVKGRKRHIVTDIMGNLLAVVVHAANIHDTKAGIDPARQALQRNPTIQKFCADAGYRKTFESQVAEELGLGVDISARIKPEWEILPKCWVVERTLAWLGGFRRLSKDYEITTSSEEVNVAISQFAVLIRCL